MSSRERAGSVGEGEKGFTAASACGMRIRVVRSGLYNFDSRVSIMASCSYRLTFWLSSENGKYENRMVEENRS